MFFDDETIGVARKQATLRAVPVPETGWTPPTDFPPLWRAPWISVDTETFDPELLAYGPGWGRKRGHIVGVSVAAPGGKWYYPIRHTVQTHFNLEASTVLSWLKYCLETPNIPKLGANLIYDIGWLAEEGIYVQGELHDVQFAEALISENTRVGLDHLAHKYLGVGKTSNELYEWCAKSYGGKPNDTQRANIYRSPPSLVGPYAEDDAELPMRVLQAQWPILEQERLLDLYQLENDLIYPLVAMRLRGVNVNVNKAEQLYDEFGQTVQQLKDGMQWKYGFPININSPKDLTKLFDQIGIEYPQTPNGNPSFRKDFLETLDHDVADEIKEIRKFEILRNTFLRGYILNGNVNGVLYGQFHPLRGDDGGTRSGRFASSDPNLQNLPVRTDEGKKVRECFEPEPGHLCWEKDDYSQIEYRLLAHFATGPGSDELRQRYSDDPNTDYHDTTQDLTKQKTGKLVSRKPIKNVNFGLLYGMSENKLARLIGVSGDDAKELFTAYHEGNPYVKATMDATSAEAAVLGYITTILGRRSRFDYWQPMDGGKDRKFALPYDAAIRMWGSYIKRAFLHKAINRRLQGSAADQMKRAIHKCWKDGVYDVIGYPKLLVHDEKDFSVIDDTPEQREAYAYMRHVMETIIPLKVPVIVESTRAINWGKTEED